MIVEILLWLLQYFKSIFVIFLHYSLQLNLMALKNSKSAEMQINGASFFCGYYKNEISLY